AGRRGRRHLDASGSATSLSDDPADHPAQPLYAMRRSELDPGLRFSHRGRDAARPVIRGHDTHRGAADHAEKMPASALSPSVNAAGPGCRISGDLISRRKPSRTAGIESKPGRAATFPGTNFLPHQEPPMISGRAAITSFADTIRSLAFLRS